MTHIKGIVRSVAALAVAGLLAIGGSARAQQAVAGGTPGWSGYAPGYSWGSTAPSVGGYAPQASAPVYSYTPSGTAWQGYTPGTAWQPYAPTTAWQGYTPAAPRAGRAPSGTMSSRPLSSANRDHGSGRNVHMHKPWLPSAPR